MQVGQSFKKKAVEKTIRYIPKIDFDWLRNRRINGVELYKKAFPDSYKANISFMSKRPNLCLPRSCIIGPIEKTVEEKVLNMDDKDCLIFTFDSKDKKRNGLFMIIKIF